MEKKYIDNICIEGARLMFKNFSGRETQYNRAGDRNVCVVIPDPEQAQRLSDDGWNIRILPPREEGDDTLYYLPVSISFKNFPPEVWFITRKKKTKADEEMVGTLDYAELRNVDLIIRPYCWEVGTKSGVKAYLKKGYFTIEEDEFASKYEDVPF